MDFALNFVSTATNHVLIEHMVGQDKNGYIPISLKRIAAKILVVTILFLRISKILLLNCFSILCKTFPHTLTSFAASLRFVPEIIYTIIFSLTAILSGVLLGLLTDSYNVLGSFKLPVICGLAWAIWSKYVPLILTIPLFVVYVSLFLMEKRTLAGDANSQRMNDQGIFALLQSRNREIEKES